jgi:hypothetical protein
VKPETSDLRLYSPMDLTRAQAEWKLGRYAFRSEDLPELAAQMMVQGFEGPAILELASFHRPMNRDIPQGLVDRAFEETGRPPLSKVAAARILARPLALDVVEGRLSPSKGASQILALAPWGDEDPGMSLFYQLDDLLETSGSSIWDRQPAAQEIIELCRKLL